MRLHSVPFTKGLCPCSDGPSKLCIRRRQHLDPRHQYLHTPPQQDAEVISEDNDEKNGVPGETRHSRPGCYRPNRRPMTSSKTVNTCPADFRLVRLSPLPARCASVVSPSKAPPCQPPHPKAVLRQKGIYTSALMSSHTFPSSPIHLLRHYNGTGSPSQQH